MRWVACVWLLVGCGRVGFDPHALGDGGGDGALGGSDAPPGCGIHLGPARVHICANTSALTAQCWGDDAFGELADPAIVDHPSAIPAPLANLVDIDGGRYETCAALASGEAWCWGEGTSGQLGDGNMTTSATPVQVANLANVVDTAPAAIHACARTSTGEVWCWGDGNNGRLGDGLNTGSATPVQVAGITDAIAVASGGSTTCAILTSHQLVCWGLNTDGQIGNNSTIDAPSPVAPMNLGPVRSVSMRDQTTCAVQTDGAVLCWGRNDLGQVGNNSAMNPVPVPAQVQTSAGPLAGADRVAVGIEHACALVAGEVWCWGNNQNGQHGDNSAPVVRPFAAKVLSLTGMVELASMGYASCAADAGGQVWCWGAGSDGQIGNGGTGDQHAPVMAVDACP